MIFDYSTRDLAKQYGNDFSYYAMKLQLLELPKKVLTRVNSKELSEGHCRHISKLVNQKNLIKKFKEQLISDNLLRRHLSDPKRFFAGKELEPIEKIKAEQRMKLSPGRGKKGVANFPHLLDSDENTRVSSDGERYNTGKELEPIEKIKAKQRQDRSEFKDETGQFTSGGKFSTTGENRVSSDGERYNTGKEREPIEKIKAEQRMKSGVNQYSPVENLPQATRVSSDGERYNTGKELEPIEKIKAEQRKKELRGRPPKNGGKFSTIKTEGVSSDGERYNTGKEREPIEKIKAEQRKKETQLNGKDKDGEPIIGSGKFSTTEENRVSSDGERYNTGKEREPIEKIKAEQRQQQAPGQPRGSKKSLVENLPQETSIVSSDGERLRNIESNEAKQRQKEHGNTAPGKPKETLEENFPQVNDTREPQTRDKVAEQLGMSGRQYDKARKIYHEAPEPIKKKELFLCSNNKCYYGLNPDITIILFLIGHSWKNIYGCNYYSILVFSTIFLKWPLKKKRNILERFSFLGRMQPPFSFLFF